MTKQTLDIIGYVCLSDQYAWDGAYGRVLAVERSARDAFSPLNRHRRDRPFPATDISRIERAGPNLPRPKALFGVARTCNGVFDAWLIVNCAHITGSGAGWEG